MNKEGKFLKKLWCCVGGRVRKTVYSSIELSSLRWPIYVINSVDHSKLPYNHVSQGKQFGGNSRLT